MSNWVSNPSKDAECWYVWDAEGPDHRIVFYGTMEDCGMVVDLLKLAEVEEEWGLKKGSLESFGVIRALEDE